MTGRAIPLERRIAGTHSLFIVESILLCLHRQNRSLDEHSQHHQPPGKTGQWHAFPHFLSRQDHNPRRRPWNAGNLEKRNGTKVPDGTSHQAPQGIAGASTPGRRTAPVNRSQTRYGDFRHDGSCCLSGIVTPTLHPGSMAIKTLEIRRYSCHDSGHASSRPLNWKTKPKGQAETTVGSRLEKVRGNGFRLPCTVLSPEQNMKSIEHTKAFDMDCPAAELFPLFSPEGETL